MLSFTFGVIAGTVAGLAVGIGLGIGLMARFNRPAAPVDPCGEPHHWSEGL